MSKPTEGSTSKQLNDKKSIPNAVLQHIMPNTECRIRYGVPLGLIVLEFMLQNNGNMKWQNHNPLNLKAEGTETGNQSGALFANDAQCYERYCWRLRTRHGGTLDSCNTLVALLEALGRADLLELNNEYNIITTEA